jgi:hypothetical protein
MAIGFAVWLPFMLFSAQFLGTAVNTLFAAVIVGLLICAVLALALFVFRRQIAKHFFGDVQLSVTAVAEAVGKAVTSWPDQARVSEAAATAAREGVAVASWMLARRTLLTVLLGMVGSVVAMVGTVLLLKQTEALEDQNRKLDAQTALLQRQNEILASEGLWELLWKVHYAQEPAIRLDAAIDLTTKGHVLRGVVLEGPAPPDGRFMHLREKPRFDDGEFDATAALVTIPERLTRAIEPQTFRSLPSKVAGSIEHSQVLNLSVDFSAVRAPQLRGLRFAQSLVEFSAPEKDGAQVCIDCVFSSSEVRVQRGRASFEGTSFRDARVSSGLGEVFIRGSKFDSMIGAFTWGRDQVRDSSGYALLLDYHGSVGEEGKPTLENTTIEHLLFRWDEREMNDVERFLQRTVHPSARIGRYYFVEERGAGSTAKLVILREPTRRANAWNSRGPRQ